MESSHPGFYLINSNYLLDSTTIYEYFFDSTFTETDFINSGWLYSGDDTPVTNCAGKSLVG